MKAGPVQFDTTGLPSAAQGAVMNRLGMLLVAFAVLASPFSHGEQTNQFYYDRDDRLVGAEYANGLAIGYVYDGNGNLVRQVHLSRAPETNGLPVLWRFLNGLSPTDNSGTNDIFADADGDGWSNYQEWKAGTNPLDTNSVPDVRGLPGTNIASLALPFTPSNFVVGVGQLDGVGAEEIVIGADGDPGTNGNSVLVLSQTSSGWTAQRVDVGAVGITSISIGQPTNRDGPAIYAGLRQVGGQGAIAEFRKVSAMWQTNTLAVSTNEAGFVLGVRPGSYVCASFSPSNGPPGGLYALFPSNTSATVTMLSSNSSRVGTFGTLLDMNPDAAANLLSRLLDRTAVRLLQATNAINILDATNLIQVPEVTNILTVPYPTNLVQLEPGPGRIPGNSVLRLENLTWYFPTPSPVDWGGAEAYGVAQGGHLTTIRSDPENSWVRTTFHFAPTFLDDVFWIGLSRANCLSPWHWTSGEPFGYSNWAPGEPKCPPGNYPCGDYSCMYVNSAGAWTAILCYKTCVPFEAWTFYGVVEVKLTNVEYRVSIPVPPATNWILWRGNTLESGTPRRQFTNSTSLFHCYLDDKNSSGLIDSGDEFVVAEYFLPGPSGQTPLLFRRTLTGSLPSPSYGLAAVNWVPQNNHVMFTGEPDGQVFSWVATNATGPSRRQLFSAHHAGKAWHALAGVKTLEPGEGLIGLRVDLTNPSRCDVIFWSPQPQLPQVAGVPQTAPVIAVLPVANPLSALAQIPIRVWDAEGNSTWLSLQYSNATTLDWSNAVIASIDGAAYSPVAAMPTGVTHQVAWDATAILPPGTTNTVWLRARGKDVTLTGDWSPPVVYQIAIPAILDSVGDGIPNSWRAQYFGGDGTTTNSFSCATCDPDGDGFTNWQEFIADTNPTNAASYLRITSLTLVPGGLRIEWQGGVQATQYLQRLDGFGTSTWQDVFTNYPPTPIINSFTNAVGTNAMQFYRIKATR